MWPFAHASGTTMGIAIAAGCELADCFTEEDTAVKSFFSLRMSKSPGFRRNVGASSPSAET